MGLDQDLTDAVDNIQYLEGASPYALATTVNALLKALSSPERSNPSEIVNASVEIPVLTSTNIGDVVELTRKAAVHSGIASSPEVPPEE